MVSTRISQASDGMTPLHLAAQSGEVEAVKHIVQTRNINVNIKVSHEEK